jgi:hypothetical protein
VPPSPPTAARSGTTPTAPPGPVIGPAGYPTALELCALALALGQVALSWAALDRLPSTVVPFFGLGAGGGGAGLPGAEAEALVWTWAVLGLWAILAGGSLLLYRAVRSSPIPVLAVGLLAHLAVMRAGMIALNLDPALSPRQVLLRAATTGLIAALLGAAVERWRSRKKLPPALVARARYDERTPRDLAFYLVAALGAGIPLLLLPTRVRVIDDGVLAITPLSYFVLPAAAIERVERAGWLQALAGPGVTLAASPGSAVRIFRRARRFPVVVSVTAPDRFLAAVEEIRAAGDR